MNVLPVDHFPSGGLVLVSERRLQDVSRRGADALGVSTATFEREWAMAEGLASPAVVDTSGPRLRRVLLVAAVLSVCFWGLVAKDWRVHPPIIR